MKFAGFTKVYEEGKDDDVLEPALVDGAAKKKGIRLPELFETTRWTQRHRSQAALH